MNLQHISYFVESIKCRSFNKAAKKFDTNVSTLTAAIDTLEKEIGIKLLFRSSHGVFLTEEGIPFFDDALEILKIQKKWRNSDLISFPALKNIPIYVAPVFYLTLMPYLTYALAETMPDIQLQPHQRLFDQTNAALIDGRVRMAIRTCFKDEKTNTQLMAKNLNMRCVSLIEDDYYVAVGKNHVDAAKHAISLEELEKKAIYGVNYLRQAYAFLGKDEEREKVLCCFLLVKKEYRKCQFKENFLSCAQTVEADYHYINKSFVFKNRLVFDYI